MELSWQTLASVRPGGLSARKTPGFPQGHGQQIGEKVEALGPRHLHERPDLIGDLLCAFARIFPASGRPRTVCIRHLFARCSDRPRRHRLSVPLLWPRTGMISWQPFLARESSLLLSGLPIILLFRLPIVLRHVAQSGHTAPEAQSPPRFSTVKITFAEDDGPNLWAVARSGYRGAVISNRRGRSSWPPRRTRILR